MALGKRLINTGGAAAACSTDSVQAFGADAAFSSNIALYQLDGNANDTTTNYDGVASSGLTYSTGLFGQAASFDGTDNILLPTGSPFNDSNTIKAVSFWVKADTSTSRVFPFSISSTTNTNDYFYIGYLGDLNRIYVAARDGSSSNQNQRYSTITSDTNWNHFVAQLNGSTVEIWMNGIQLTVVDDISGTATSSSWISYPSYSGTVRGAIGVLRLSTPQYSNGQIDQVRIFDRAITPEEVSTLYNETTSTASNTNPLSDGSGVALYSLDYDASDAGGLYDGTPTNVDFGVDGQINYGARFNGSSSYIDVSSLIYLFDSKATATVSLWFNTSTTATTSVLFSDYASSTARNFLVSINSTGNIVWNTRYGSGAGRDSNITTTSTYNDGSWHYIVLSIDQAANAKSMYVDGSQIGSSIALPTATGASFDSTQRVTMGSSYNTGTAAYQDYYNGKIDQVRIFSKALSSDEVDTLYAETACVYTSTTDIVDYPTSASNDIVAYYKLDNSSEDFKGSYDGTDSNVEYRFGRFGQAADFNGISSKITLPTGSPFNDSDTIKAVSAWVKADTSLSRVWPLSISSTSNANYFWYIGYMGDLNRIYIAVRNGSSSNESIAYAITTTDTNWHHIFVQITATGKEIYLDGVKQTVTYSNTGSSTNTSWISYPSYSGTVQGAIGVLRLSSPQYSNGFVDQVRIYDAALTSDQVTELYNEKPEVDTSNFKAVLYEGNGATQYISNVGFQPDLVWIKNRNSTQSHRLYDSVRGANLQISSNQTATENNSGGLTSFDSNGFSLDNWASVNTNGNTYVSWVFKGGGDAVNIGVNSITGSTPSIASDVSANTDAGFSIVKYTGNGSDGATVGHGIGTPELIIVKDLDNSSNWMVKVPSIMTDDRNFLYINSSSGIQTAGSTTFIKGIDSNTFTLGSSGQTNTLNDDYIAYCFHSVAGYSKIGSYEGDGTNDYSKEITGLGFDPSFVMVKNVDSSGSNWEIIDSRRGDVKNLYANESYAENANSPTSYGSGKFITDGFEVARGSVSSSVHWNKSGDNYLYMAFK